LDCLRLGDVAVMDRCFAVAELFVEIKRRSADALTRLHARFTLEQHSRTQLGPDEWLVDLVVDRDARRRNPNLPKTLRVRVVNAGAPQGRAFWLMTTLLDPIAHPAEELRSVYLQRWGAETSYAELKVDLHLAVARSETVEGVYKEIEAHLAAYNYVRLLMIRAALHAGVDPIRLSFRETVRLMIGFTMISRIDLNGDRAESLWENLLVQIGTRRVPPRPGRRDPRAIKRRPTFPRWNGSRKSWRQALC
jgi:hypothetical protein